MANEKQEQTAKSEEIEEMGRGRILREVLPNDFEFEKRDSINKQSIMVSLPVSETVRVRAFTNSEVRSLDTIKSKERDDFRDFCIKYPQFEGIFYAQFKKDTVLSNNQLLALDFIQDIKETNKRIIYQKSGKVTLKEFENRIKIFVSEHKGKINIPILDLNAIDIFERQILRNKIEWLIKNNFEKVAVIFRGRKIYKKAWYIALPRLAEKTETYIFEVPTKKDNGFSPLIFAFLMGASKVSHIRKLIGRGGIVTFLERTWEKKPLNTVSIGLANYNGQNRKQFLASDKRKGIVYPFSKWDTIVQANEFCRADLTISDLKKVLILKKAIRNFS